MLLLLEKFETLLGVFADELLKLIKPVEKLDKFAFKVADGVDETCGVAVFELGVFEPIIDEPNEKLPKPKLLLLLLTTLFVLLLFDTFAFDVVVLDVKFELMPTIEFEVLDC